jgi:hypothetical protein
VPSSSQKKSPKIDSPGWLITGLTVAFSER